MTQLIYDADKLRVRICGGVHCASNGGGRALEAALDEALAAWGVQDQVEVFRAHCLGECAEGPCVRIGTDRFYHVSREEMQRLVRDEILPRLL